MFMSRCEINPARRGARKLLGSPQAMHAAVMSCFPRSQAGQAGRVLWRLDEIGQAQFLLVTSASKPDLSVIEEQAGWREATTTQYKKYGPFLDRIGSGQKYQFKLTANPTHSVRREGSRSKRLPHVGQANQERWLLERSESNGFIIPELGNHSGEPLSGKAFSVTGSATWRFRRNSEQGRNVTVQSVSYEGVLEVVDALKFRHVLANGIGSGKAYGCGLLTVVPHNK